MKFTYLSLVSGALKCGYIKRLITLTSDYIRQLSMHIFFDREEKKTANNEGHLYYSTAVLFNLFWFTAPYKTEKNLTAPLPGLNANLGHSK